MDQEKEILRRHHNGKRFAGFIVVLVGTVLLCKQFGVIMPEWIISWPMLIIAIGILVGAKHRFRGPGWIIVTLVGAVFLADKFVEGFSIGQYFWPVFIIAAGLLMIFSPRRRWHHHHQHEQWWHKRGYANFDFMSYNQDDYIDSVAIFGGLKKNIISKDFKGGEVVCVFGGADINLSQAEINGPVVLEIVSVFGGAKLIVPANWEIKSEMVAILGGIEDKRMPQATPPDHKNVLMIRGTTIFGGIEIKSF